MSEKTVLVLNEVTEPVAPSTGKVYLYTKGDGKAYIKDDNGLETDLTETDNQLASEVAFTPAGTIAANNVQTAIEELDDEIQNLGSMALENVGANGTFESADGKYITVTNGIITIISIISNIMLNKIAIPEYSTPTYSSPGFQIPGII